MVARLVIAFWFVSLAAFANDAVRTSICRHPDDEADNGRGHAFMVCGDSAPPQPGHPFSRNDASRVMTCDTCAAAHPDSPEGCKIVDISCPNLRVIEAGPAEPEPTPEPEAPPPKEDKSKPKTGLLFENSRHGAPPRK